MIPNCIYFLKGQIMCFLLSHKNTQRLAFFLCVNILAGITQIFPHCDVDMWGRFNEVFQPSLDLPSLLDRINLLVGDFELCNSADRIHEQTATLKEKENKKSHHMTPLKPVIKACWLKFFKLLSKSKKSVSYSCLNPFTMLSLICTIYVYSFSRCFYPKNLTRSNSP